MTRGKSIKWRPGLARYRLVCATLFSALALAGCALWPEREPQPAGPLTQLPLRFSVADQARWETVALPGKLRSQFRKDKRGDRVGLKVESAASVSMLRQRLHIAPERLGTLVFDWQVANLIEGADMTQREHSDSPARIVLAFEGDRSRFSAKNAMLSELARTLTGEEMPYATLMYVWSNHHPVGTVITNTRTDRVRKIVVESGPANLNRWLRHERNIAADFERAFGEPPGALQGLAIMTDTDNTRGRTQAWYGEIRLD